MILYFFQFNGRGSKWSKSNYELCVAMIFFEPFFFPVVKESKFISPVSCEIEEATQSSSKTHTYYIFGKSIKHKNHSTATQHCQAIWEWSSKAVWDWLNFEWRTNQHTAQQYAEKSKNLWKRRKKRDHNGPQNKLTRRAQISVLICHDFWFHLTCGRLERY